MTIAQSHITLLCILAGLLSPGQFLFADSDTTKSYSGTSIEELGTEPSSQIDSSNEGPIVGAATRYTVLPNKDTVLITSGYGDLWFGLFGGANIGAYLGELNLALNRSSQVRRLGRGFGSGSSLGYFVGATAEWKKPEWRWGFGLNISFLDLRDGAFESLDNQSVITEYEGETSFSYITVSPTARMDIIGGLYAYGGFDFEFNVGAEALIIPTIDTSAVIQEQRKAEIEANGFRIGLHVGAAYEFLFLEIADKARVRLGPFVSFHYGSEVSNNLNSDLNLGFMRVGLAMKVGPNSERRTIRRFDPNFIEPPVYLASLPQRFDYEVPSLRPDERIEAIQLAVIERPVIEAVVDTVTTAPPVVASAEIRSPQPEPKPVNIADLNEEYVLGVVGGALSTELTKSSYAYLDAVADFLNRNPNVEAQIAGYTDNFGTPEETQRVSELRASHVVNYLEGKGISRSRLFPSGLGARSAIANNITEEGRRRNRRVGVTLIE